MLSKRVRRWIKKIHRWLGLTLLVPLVLLGLSGAPLVFQNTLERWLAPDVQTVTPGPSSVDLSSIREKAQTAYPQSGIHLMNLPISPTDSIELVGRDQFRVYADPYTGRILGAHHYGDTLLGWLHQFHVSFFMGELGATLGGLCSLFALLSLVSGIIEWWPRGRRKRQAFVIRFKGRWKQTNFDIHRVMGFYLTPVVFVILLTGSVFTFYYTYESALLWMTGSPEPEQRAFPPPLPSVPEEAHPLPLDRLVTTARQRFPDANVTRVGWYEDPSKSWRVQMRLQGEAYSGGRTYVFVNPFNAEVVDAWDPREDSTSEWILSKTLHFHLGFWGGYFGESWRLVTQVLWFIGALMPPALGITGLLVWWNPGKRRRRRNH